MVRKEQTRHNKAESPSSPPKEVVHASCSQRRPRHVVHPGEMQRSSFSSSRSSHVATTKTLPKGMIGLLMKQSTADTLLDICSVHPQTAPKKEHENK